MIDPKLIDTDPDAVIAALASRGVDASEDVKLLVHNRTHIKKNATEAQAAQSEKNRLSKEIGQMMKDGRDPHELRMRVAHLSGTITRAEWDQSRHAEAFDRRMQTLPNLPAPDVPLGRDENDNVEVRRHASPTFPEPFKGTPLDHVEIGRRMGLMDFEAAAAVSGSRFVVLRGALARLERAIGDFMLDAHLEEGWEEVSPPTLVKDHAMVGTGQFPKFVEDAYATSDGLYLIPTSEVSLTNLYRDQIIDRDALPIRMTAQTMCYRREAGSAGRDTKGMIRQHQFKKVELVALCGADESEAMHQAMVGRAEDILHRLGLPYRVMLLCTGDMGFSARKTYDLEVWLPSQNTFREISSVSNCGDFQARRMGTRWKPDPKGKTEFVHTLNGSGLAVGRTLVAILENYQRPDGSVEIPNALCSYMNARRIEPDGTLSYGYHKG